MKNKRDHNRKKIYLNPEQLSKVKDTSISGRQLSSILGLSAELINKCRRDLGISFRRGNSKNESKSGINKTIPKKPHKETETIFEAEHRLKREAKAISKGNTDAEKIKSGTHKWITIEYHGIKTKALRKL